MNRSTLTSSVSVTICLTGITRHDHVSRQSAAAATVHKIRGPRLRCCGHVTEADDSAMTKKISLRYDPGGDSTRGRTRNGGYIRSERTWKSHTQFRHPKQPVCTVLVWEVFTYTVPRITPVYVKISRFLYSCHSSKALSRSYFSSSSL